MSMDREEIGEFAKILVQSLDPIEVSGFYKTYHEIVGNERWDEYTKLATRIVNLRRDMDKRLIELDNQK